MLRLIIHFNCFFIFQNHLRFWKVKNKLLWTEILIFFNWGIPASFSFIFGLFQTNIDTILQQINVKICPSSIWRRDSNPQPSENEAPPITTRPGLPPIKFWNLDAQIFFKLKYSNFQIIFLLNHFWKIFFCINADFSPRLFLEVLTYPF